MPTLFEEGMLVKRNHALDVHPSSAYYRVTDGGSNLAWAIMALHAILLLAVIAWAFVSAANRRVFHYFSIAILFVATIYYFIIASNLGSSQVLAGDDLSRQIFYARWVGYTINFTLIMIALLILSTVGWAAIFLTVVLTLIWGSMYLIGMFISTSFKWGFFVFAIVANLLIAWQLLGNARGWARRVDVAMHKSYSTLSAYIVGLMFLYAICWAVSEATNRITPNREMVYYAVLDVLSQGIFALMLLFLTRSLDYDFLRLGRSEHGRVRLGTEKGLGHHHDGAVASPTAGTATGHV